MGFGGGGSVKSEVEPQCRSPDDVTQRAQLSQDL